MYLLDHLIWYLLTETFPIFRVIFSDEKLLKSTALVVDETMLSPKIMKISLKQLREYNPTQALI